MMDSLDPAPGGTTTSCRGRKRSPCCVASHTTEPSWCAGATPTPTTRTRHSSPSPSGTSICVVGKKVKESFDIAQYPVRLTVQSALHFTSLTDLFTQTPSRLLWEASSRMLQLIHEGCSCTYPSLSIVRYSFIQLSELEQCRVKKLAQDFNTAAQDSNPGSRSQESEALPLSHCDLQCSYSQGN